MFTPAGLVGVMRQRPLMAFFILAFAFTWAVEMPMQLLQIAALQFVVGWMPGLAAVLVAGVIGGSSGIKALLRGLLVWRVGAQWYALALFGFLALWLGTQAINPLFGGSGLHLPPLSAALVIGLVAELAIRMLLSSEQLAWSGFALPRLQARHSALIASVLLGLIWAAWHLPLFFVPGSQADAGFAIFAVGAICTRIILTWVFNSTGGSVLLCMLLHQSINTWTDVLAPAVPTSDRAINQWLGLALNLIVVAVVVLVFGAKRLSREHVSELPIAVDPQFRVAGVTA